MPKDGILHNHRFENSDQTTIACPTLVVSTDTALKENVLTFVRTYETHEGI
jgi:hypothetical protein